MNERHYGRVFGHADREAGRPPTVNLDKAGPDEFDSGYIEAYRSAAHSAPRKGRS